MNRITNALQNECMKCGFSKKFVDSLSLVLFDESFLESSENKKSFARKVE